MVSGTCNDDLVSIGIDHQVGVVRQPDRDGGTFQGLAGAPAVGPDRRGADKIIEPFQGDAGGKGSGTSSGSRPRGRVQPGKAAGSTGEATRGVAGESMTAIL